MKDRLDPQLWISGTEHFHVLCLNGKRCLLSEETMSLGGADKVSLSPRDIMKRALELDASGIILVHNHPSGDPTPSRVDIATTADIAAAGKLIDVYIYDHVIVASGGWSSFRSLGLL